LGSRPSDIYYTSVPIPPILEGGDMVKVFVDFQNRVPHRVYIPGEDRVYKVRDESFIDFLEIAGLKRFI